jgi:hypothetical protein
MELRFITSSRQAVMKISSKKISIGDIGQCRLLKIFHAKLVEEHLQVDIGTIAVLHVGWMNEVISDMGLHASEAAAAVHMAGFIHGESPAFGWHDAFH